MKEEVVPIQKDSQFLNIRSAVVVYKKRKFKVFKFLKVHNKKKLLRTINTQTNLN